MKKITLTVAFFGLLLFALAKPVNASSTVWSRTYGGAGHDHGESVIQTSDGGYALAGTSVVDDIHSDTDAWLIKTDSEGIIPEFPSLTILLIMMVAVVAVTIFYKHNLSKLNFNRWRL